MMKDRSSSPVISNKNGVYRNANSNKFVTPGATTNSKLKPYLPKSSNSNVVRVVRISNKNHLNDSSDALANQNIKICTLFKAE